MADAQDQSQLNFEQLAAEVSRLESGAGAQDAQRAAAAIDPSQICSYYQKVKPYLELILRIPFIPAAIKTAIQGFMAVMNTVCPM